MRPRRSPPLAPDHLLEIDPRPELLTERREIEAASPGAPAQSEVRGVTHLSEPPLIVRLHRTQLSPPTNNGRYALRQNSCGRRLYHGLARIN